MADSTLPAPRYSIWQAISCALSLSARAIEEVRALAARPPVPGRPGKDGFSLDDFVFEYDGERRFTFKFERGELKQEKVCVLPIPIDRGVWREGQRYERGDSVSFGGSSFAAQEDTTDKPETSKAWRLTTKKGRDGKDGVMRQIPPPGPIKLP